MTAKRGGLGKGLTALFDENATDNAADVELKISEIEPNRKQPRKDFDEDALAALAESIQTHGLLQPVVVRPLPGGTYELVAGERRWRASRMAGLTVIPAIIREMDEQTAAEVAMVENLQREDLNPYEEALGYRTLMERFSMTQETVAARVGKSRAAVANTLRLMQLPDEMLNALRTGKITAGQARALLAACSEERQKEMFRCALDGASVRVLEAMAKQKAAVKKPAVDSQYYTEVALALKQELHRPVKIRSTGKGKGTLTLEFYSEEELGNFAMRLSGSDKR